MKVRHVAIVLLLALGAWLAWIPWTPDEVPLAPSTTPEAAAAPAGSANPAAAGTDPIPADLAQAPDPPRLRRSRPAEPPRSNGVQTPTEWRGIPP